MNEATTVDHSEQLGALAKALAAVQGEVQDAKKDSVNPHFKNRYASLGSVRAAVTATLAKNGIAVVQTFEPHGPDGVCVVTTLLHESGQWMRSRLYLPVSKKDAQGFGSAISYARRYALAAIVGIAADDDDDGEAAVGKPANDNKSGAKAVQEQSTTAEASFAKRLDEAKTTDDLAKVQGDVSKAVQTGILTDSARARLRERNAAAVKRISASAA